MITIPSYNEMFCPFMDVIVDNVSILDIFKNRLISMQIEYEDEKEDMLTLQFDNRDYAISDSPYFSLNKSISIIWGYLANLDSDRGFIVKDFNGLEKFTVVAYKGGAKSNIDDNALLEYEEDEYGVSTSDTPLENPVPPEAWSKGAIMSVSYRTLDRNNIIISFDPAIKTNNQPSSFGIEDIDTESKGFFSTLVETVGGKLGLSQETINNIQAGGQWVIDGVTGAYEYVKGKAQEVIQKIFPTKKSSSDDDLTGGLGGGTEITTEATMITLGIPKVRNGSNINVFNVGKKFSGKWYIKRVTHNLTDGYKLEFLLQRPSVFPGQEAKNIDNKHGSSDSISKSSSLDNCYIVDGFDGSVIRERAGWVPGNR